MHSTDHANIDAVLEPSTYDLLHAALRAVKANPTADQFMNHHNVEFGITKNRTTFSVFTLTRGHFHPISNAGDLTIIIYKESKHLGFGLFNEDKDTCLPIDIDELIAELELEDDPHQRNWRRNMILDNLADLARPEQ